MNSGMYYRSDGTKIIPLVRQDADYLRERGAWLRVYRQCEQAYRQAADTLQRAAALDMLRFCEARIAVTFHPRSLAWAQDGAVSAFMARTDDLKIVWSRKTKTAA